MSAYDIINYIMGILEEFLHSPISGHILLVIPAICILCYLLSMSIRFVKRYFINNYD